MKVNTLVLNDTFNLLLTIFTAKLYNLTNIFCEMRKAAFMFYSNFEVSVTSLRPLRLFYFVLGE